MTTRMKSSEPERMQTRRQVIVAAAAVGLGGLSLCAIEAWAANEGEISHAEESIHQETIFKANRKLIYEALTETKQFDKVIRLSAAIQSGMSLGAGPTDISPQVGGAFSVFGGHIVGRHIELVRNERIVQAWRVVNWDPGHYSIAKFELVEQGSGTRLIFNHTGFPKGQAEHLAAGWKGNYWEPLEKYLG
ncbi:MAG TPA: SRPBCC domain-containing protein [Candidatus Angelobacter sp.]|nr:SRPBCC domain-containing protein [Candidatus Angelobacter sp.]